MKVTILNLDNAEEIDNAIIPNVIYNETINKEREKIQNYFILHPYLMYSFVGYNSALKLSDNLFSVKKCNCYYTLPWKTYYAVENNLDEKISLSFAQQISEYRYMILNWYPSPRISHMQYLSNIALGMIQDIGVFRYNLSNNLDSSCTIFQKKYYTNNFKNPKLFYNYITQMLVKINKA
jgi:hypothetical protein